MKILLVFPGPKGVKDVNMPLPALFLAAPLIKKNINVRIIDTRLRDINISDLDDIGCIGITSMSGAQLHYALKAAKLIRRFNRKIPIVWGGQHVTALPEQSAKSRYVDFVVKGEGEETFTELIQAISEGKMNFRDIKGIVYREPNGKIVLTPPRKILDLDKMESLPYKLIDISRYPNIKDKFEFLTSKGCPYNCSFCCNEINYERMWRGKSPNIVIKELEEIINNFNPDRITIIDANFFVNIKRAKKILRLIMKEGIKKKFYTSVRCDIVVNLFDDEMFELLRKAGFREIAFGAESGSDDMLKYIRKNTTREQIIETVRLFKKHRIIPVISFMCGFPYETRKRFNETIELYDKIMKIYPEAQVNGMFIFTPFPGSALANVVEDEFNYKPPIRLEEWAETKWSDAKKIRWVTKERMSTLETASTIVRFFFIEKLMKGWSWKQKILRHGNPFLVIASEIVIFVFSISARIRWKFRWFGYGYEWRIWSKLLFKFKGNE